MSVLTFQQREDPEQFSIQTRQASFIRSQLILLQSRRKWGLVYAFATLAGLFCIPGGMVAAASLADPFVLISRTISLPLASFMIIVGMYVLNDLVDTDLDRANHKKRPIPTGQVTKGQVWAFVGLTNGAGILLAALTLNPVSVVIALSIAVIGIMYSAPKISLKDRFVIKTLAIALAMALCALLGATSTFGLELGSTNSLLPAYIALMLGTMIFITSPFNDMGDVAGDKAAGRRTIPIVIGKENTVKMAIVLAIGMATTSWLFYALGIAGFAASIGVSFVSSLAAVNIFKVLNRTDDTEYVRKKHKLSYPLHVMLQSAIVAGMLLI
ncbi:UbiA family prenyltransferase [Nitrososphaera sp.]|uniref:UbiA family prenyltransferase n=1 Tax=Nitrososphaera sp. TaxID=1971748 RepID=UPI0034579498